MAVIAVAAGGFAGALLRYWLSSLLMDRIGRKFPVGTLTVNLSGTLALGLMVGLAESGLALPPAWRLAAGAGLLGAYTTFSTWQLETLSLLSEGRRVAAGLNLLVSIGAGLAVAWLGIVLGRWVL